MSAVASSGCALCSEPGGVPVHRATRWRLIRADDPHFPAFYRLVWNAHVAEFTDLAVPERSECMRTVAIVERVLREALAPTKINLASLGNAVPHLHWHVIARFDWDSHFPNPVWGSALREVPGGAAARLAVPLDALDRHLAAALAATSLD